MDKAKQSKNFERFTDLPIQLMGFLGINLKSRQTVINNLWIFGNLCNILVLIIRQCVGLVNSASNIEDRSSMITYINYDCIGMGKLLSADQINYNLEAHIRTYVLVERILYHFTIYILITYLCTPIVQSFYDLFRSGHFTYRLALTYPTYFENSYISYCMELCMSFDMLAKKLMDLQPDSPHSLRSLNHIIRRHQNMLRLTEEINEVLTPSIMFSLLSSSFILCFSTYRLVNETNPIAIFKILILLTYELKQVVITCYFGDKLMESSLLIFNAAYMHNWSNASEQYKRQMILILMKAQQPVSLKFAGIVDVSFITLKQVFSMAYQIFALLKSF